MIRTLLKRSSVHFGGLVLLRIVSTVLFIAFARVFAPDVFGQLIFFSTIVTFITVIGAFGLPQWYQRQHEIEESKKFWWLVHARLFTLLLSITFAFPVLLFTHSFPTFTLLITILSLIPEAFLTMYDGYYLEHKQAYIIPAVQTVRFIFLALPLFLFKETLTINATILFFLLGSIIVVIIGFPKEMLKTRVAFSLRKTLTILRSSAQYAVLITTSYAYSRGDALIIRYTISEAALGVYGAAYRYLEGVSLLPTAIAQNLFHLTARGEVGQKHVVKLTVLSGLIGFIVSSLLFLSAHFLTFVVLGEKYYSAEAIVKILSIVVFFFFINAPLSTFIQSTNLLKKFLPFGIANTVLNLLLNIFFVPKYGIQAAAFVMLTTEVTGLFINCYFVATKNEP